MYLAFMGYTLSKSPSFLLFYSYHWDQSISLQTILEHQIPWLKKQNSLPFNSPNLKLSFLV